MKGLVLPSGAPIDPAILSGLKADGCDGIRQVAFDNVSPLDAWLLAKEILDAGMQPYLSLTTREQIAQIKPRSGVLIGWWNEPDLGDIDHEDYIASFEDVMTEAHAKGLRIYAGEVSNLNDRGFKYLKRLPWDRWDPAVVGCAYHRYPNGGPMVPHDRYQSRHHEMETLRGIVGYDRPLLRGEVGYNNLDYSEQDAATFLLIEREFDVAEHVDWTFAYQGNDGPADSTNVLDHYGLWRSAGYHDRKPAYFSFFG